MIRKIAKYTLGLILTLVGLLLLLSVLVYLPPIQNFIKTKAVSYVTDNLGLDLSIDRLRLRFPAVLSVDNTIAITPEGDTLIRAARLDASVKLLPLLAGNVRFGDISLADAGFHYRDSVSDLSVKGTLSSLTVGGARLGLKENTIDVSAIGLQKARVELLLGNNPGMDTTANDTVSTPWHFKSRRVELSEIEFHMVSGPGEFQIEAMLPDVVLTVCDVNLGKNSVTAEQVTLRQGDYSFYNMTSGSRAVPETPKGQVMDDQETSPPWTIAVRRVELENNSGFYGYRTGNPNSGFDASHIRVTGLDLEVDSLYNRSSEISGSLKSLRLSERSGLEVTSGQGRFTMDSTGIYAAGINITTPYSSVRLNGSIIEGVEEAVLPGFSFDGESIVDMAISSRVAGRDLLLFIPAYGPARTALYGNTFQINGAASGTLEDLEIPGFEVVLPGHADLKFAGNIMDLADPSRLSGDIRLDGSFSDLEFIKGFIADTSIRNRIGFPTRLSLSGTVGFSPEKYSPDITIYADSGRLALRGDVVLNPLIYDIEAAVDNFPVGEFLPRDSLGILSFDLTAKGSGVDFLSESTTADIDLAVHRLDFRGYPFTDIAIDARVGAGVIDGSVVSEDLAMELYLDIDGRLTRDNITARLQGKIIRADLYAAHLSSEPLGFAMTLDADAEMNWARDTAYMVEITMDSILLTHGRGTEHFGMTFVRAAADSTGVTAIAHNGDMDLAFRSRSRIDDFVNELQNTASVVQTQIDSTSIDMARIQEELPQFRLNLTAGRDNILNDYLRERGLEFNNLRMVAATDTAAPFRTGIVINGFKTAGLTLDTLNIGLSRKDSELDYFVRLANRPGNIEQMALIRIRGNAVGNSAHADFYQRDRSDSVGFRFGLDATLRDSAVRFTMTPENPVFGYESWRVNTNNYIVYNYNGDIDADLRLDGNGQHLYITSADMPGDDGIALNVDAENLDVGTLMKVLPSAPPVDAKLSADARINFRSSDILAHGTATIADFKYDGNRIGDFALQLDYASDSTVRRINDFVFSVGGTTVLTASGEITSSPGGNILALDANMTSFPLEILNGFVPEQSVEMEGNLGGNISLSGTLTGMNIDGNLAFEAASATVDIIGTRFGLSSQPLTFNNSIMDFNNFTITSPNNQALTIDGKIDLRKLTDPTLNVDIAATNFDAVNSSRNTGSDVYGKALLDIDITAEGPLDGISVEGDIRLLNGTDITYVLRDGPVSVEDQRQDLVTFVSFADSLWIASGVSDTLPVVASGGMDILVNIDIDQGVKANINLSEDGNNRIELEGDGQLYFSMNSQGDSRFTGRYTLSGGTFVYNPPVISAKSFTINDGSYVEWTGEIADPTFNITATETVRATVSTDDNYSNTLNFNIIVHVRNTLEDLDIVFDLESPDDLTIQNQLASLAPEQRSTQAMSLLVYNTYTGPGTTAKVDTNNPLNSFIEKELNQWARNSLSGVDLSFGINSVDDRATGGSQHTDYSYKVSKSLFDDRIKVTVGGSINPDDNTVDNLQNNFVEDIVLEYRLNNRDNMFLKAYRYNTQESILEGEVIETGFGFVARKKVNKLKELFRLRRSPEKKQAREEKKEFRKRIREEENTDGADPAKQQSQDTPLFPDSDQKDEDLNQL